MKNILYTLRKQYTNNSRRRDLEIYKLAFHYNIVFVCKGSKIIYSLEVKYPVRTSNFHSTVA